MTLRDYFTSSEVKRNYGEYGLEQGFMCEFSVESDFYLEMVLHDIRTRMFFYSLDRKISNLASLWAIGSYFFSDTPLTISLIALGMSELYRFRRYKHDIKHRKEFERYKEVVMDKDLKSTDFQREEFKLRYGLEAPF